MKNEQRVGEALRGIFSSPNVLDSNLEEANIVDVIAQVASAIRFAAKHLGNGDASTAFGALEAHGMCIQEAGHEIGNGLESIAGAIREMGEHSDVRNLARPRNPSNERMTR